MLIALMTGGIIYFYFEIFVRGYSHISMMILGGICFLLVGKVGNKLLRGEGSHISKIIKIMLFSGIVITLLELLTGYIVNINMGLRVWDYRSMNYNYKGQICLLYSLLWSLMGLPCVYFYGILEMYIFGEENNELME